MKLVYCSANIYLLLYISHFLLIISCRHLKHTADKCTCAWEFKKPFIFCFITLRCIQAKINEQLMDSYCKKLFTWREENYRGRLMLYSAFVFCFRFICKTLYLSLALGSSVGNNRLRLTDNIQGGSKFVLDYY